MAVEITIETPLQDDVRTMVSALNATMIPLTPREFQFQLTVEQMIEAHLHIASSLTVSSSYKEAMKETNAALALDPRNMEALAQRARIEQASSEGLGLDIF